MAKRADKGEAGGTVPVNVELEPAVNGAIQAWATEEGRSKRRHLAVLARKLVELRDEQPDDLVRLGLMTRKAGKK